MEMNNRSKQRRVFRIDPEIDEIVRVRHVRYARTGEDGPTFRVSLAEIAEGALFVAEKQGVLRADATAENVRVAHVFDENDKTLLTWVHVQELLGSGEWLSVIEFCPGYDPDAAEGVHPVTLFEWGATPADA